MLDSLYCKLFVNSRLSKTRLLNVVVTAIEGTQKPFGSVDCEWGVIDVRRNDEYRWWSWGKRNAPDGFLFFRYIIDIEPQEEAILEEHYISRVKSLVQYLRTQKCEVVAACDFESELEE